MRRLTIIPLIAASILIQWDAPTDSALVDHYVVEYCHDGAGWAAIDSVEHSCLLVAGIADGSQNIRARVAWVTAGGLQGAWSIESEPVSDNRLPGVIGQATVTLDE